MNKIPKCKNKNPISRQPLKLSKKFSGGNRINNPNSKIFTGFDSNKSLKKDSKNSIAISTKPSTISSASSKNNSIISSKNVNIYLYFKFLFIYFIIF